VRVSRTELSQACLPACLHDRHLTRELGANTTPPLFRTAHLIKKRAAVRGVKKTTYLVTTTIERRSQATVHG
jgi:hypothetical protein